MFVTAQDFEQIPYRVPTAKTTQPNGDVVANPEFDAYIQKKEVEIIRNILGVDFYNAYLDGIAALPAAWEQRTSPDGYAIDDEVTQDEMVFKSLVADNVLPTTDETAWVEVPNIWLLLKNGDDYIYIRRKYIWNGFKSILVPAIFSMWLKDTFDNYSNLGISIPELENGQWVNPSRRIVAANNDFISKLGNYYRQEGTLYGYVWNKNLLDGRFSTVYDPTLFNSFGAYLAPGFHYYGLMNIFNI